MCIRDRNMYDPIKPLVPSRDMFEDEIAAYQPTYVWELKVPGMRPLLSEMCIRDRGCIQMRW